jgi:hypothetical protein
MESPVNDLAQVRRRAKELKRAVVVGEKAAVDRVMLTHPKWVGQSPLDFEAGRFSLRDAQLTVAGSWASRTGLIW